MMKINYKEVDQREEIEKILRNITPLEDVVNAIDKLYTEKEIDSIEINGTFLKLRINKVNDNKENNIHIGVNNAGTFITEQETKELAHALLKMCGE